MEPRLLASLQSRFSKRTPKYVKFYRPLGNKYANFSLLFSSPFQTRLLSGHQPLSVTPMLHTPRASRTAPKSHKLPKRTSPPSMAEVNAVTSGGFARDARSCDNISNYARNRANASVAKAAVPAYAKVSLEKLKQQRSLGKPFFPHYRHHPHLQQDIPPCPPSQFQDDDEDDGGFGVVATGGGYPFYSSTQKGPMQHPPPPPTSISHYHLGTPPGGGRHRIQPLETGHMATQHQQQLPIRLTDSYERMGQRGGVMTSSPSADVVTSSGRLTAHLYPKHPNRNSRSSCSSSFSASANNNESAAAGFLNNNASHYEVIPSAAASSSAATVSKFNEDNDECFIDDSSEVESSVSRGGESGNSVVPSSEDDVNLSGLRAVGVSTVEDDCTNAQ